MTLLDQIKAKVDSSILATRDLQAITTALNIGRTKPSTREIGNGTILEVLGLNVGNALLDAINNVPDFRHVKPLVEQGRLIIGTPLVADALMVMVAGGVLSKADADKLLAIAVDPDPATELEVNRALWADNGDYLA